MVFGNSGFHIQIYFSEFFLDLSIIYIFCEFELYLEGRKLSLVDSVELVGSSVGVEGSSVEIGGS